MGDQTKPTKQPQDADAAKKRRLEELKARIATNPRFKIAPPSGTGFIIGMPGGMRPKPATKD
jgi:hypothetical protein